jgi:methionyl-tRNA formyltransferase
VISWEKKATGTLKKAPLFIKTSLSEKRIAVQKTLHLFGGGNLLVEAAKIGQRSHFVVVVRTSKRLVGGISRWEQQIKKMGIRVFIDNSLSKVMQKGPIIKRGDLGFSFGAPWIFKKDWIDQWEGRIFNCHNRALPSHRGAGGSSWLILMRERIGASTIHRISAGIDAGSIVYQEKYRFPQSYKHLGKIDSFVESKAKKFLRRYFPKILRGQAPVRKSDSRRESYWPRLNTGVHGWINWEWQVGDIVLFCRAFGRPFEGAKTLCRGRIIRIFDLRLAGSRQDTFHPFQAGLIFRRDRNGNLWVAHPEGYVCITGWSSADGSTPKLGDRLYTPQRYLEKSLMTRVQYLPSGRMLTN